MKKRALRIAVPIAAACLLAGSVYAFFAGPGSLSHEEWKTASGVSLQVPTAGAPKLAFTAQPAAGAAIQASRGVFNVSVAIQDSHGTTLSSDSVDTVTLALGRNPGGGVLHCTDPGGRTLTVSLGQATFSGCSISKPGTGYRLTASSSVKPVLAPPANGHAFDIVSAAAAKAASRTALLKGTAAGPNQATAGGGRQPGPAVSAASPGHTAPGLIATELTITSPAVTGAATASPVLGPITVQLTTAGGIPVTTGGAVELSSSSSGVSEFSATRGGPPAALIVVPPGASTATFYYGDELAGQPVITVAAAGAAPATQAETITAGRAAGLSFADASTGNAKGSHRAQAACTGTAGNSFSCTLSPAAPRGKSRFMTARVLLIDQFQNVVTNTSGSAIDVTLSQTGGSSVSPGSVPIPAGSSSSDLFTEQLADGTHPGTVTATATVGQGQQAAASLTS